MHPIPVTEYENQTIVTVDINFRIHGFTHFIKRNCRFASSPRRILNNIFFFMFMIGTVNRREKYL